MPHRLVGSDFLGLQRAFRWYNKWRVTCFLPFVGGVGISFRQTIIRMPKYLRHIAQQFVTGNDPFHSKSVPIDHSVRDANIHHLCWMYEFYATPLRTEGIGKVNVYFTVDSDSAPPVEVLGFADVWEAFDVQRFSKLVATAQQHLYLDHLHNALTGCAAHFDWKQENLEAAYRRIIQESFTFHFFWKRPLSSPDRRTKVQVYVEVQRLANIYLVFFDRDMNELQRTLFSVALPGSGVPEATIGKIKWDDNETIRIVHSNGRDSWLINLDGEVAFHYPRAERGNAHGEFDLGLMYFEGRQVLKDQKKALELIESSASKGYKHAVRFLKSRTESSGE